MRDRSARQEISKDLLLLAFIFLLLPRDATGVSSSTRVTPRLDDACNHRDQENRSNDDEAGRSWDLRDRIVDLMEVEHHKLRTDEDQDEGKTQGEVDQLVEQSLE